MYYSLLTLIIGADYFSGFYPCNRALMDFPAARQVESPIAVFDVSNCFALLSVNRLLLPFLPRVKCYYHSAKLTRTKDSSVSRRYRGKGKGVIEPHWQLDNITVGLRNNEEILFVIVNDRSRYCSVARECLFKKRRKKKGREGKGGKKNVYSRLGGGIDNSRHYLEIFAFPFEREFFFLSLVRQKVEEE